MNDSIDTKLLSLQTDRRLSADQETISEIVNTDVPLIQDKLKLLIQTADNQESETK